MKPKVKLRADGNSQMGLGHVFRMIAFSDILKMDFECSFLIKDADDSLIQLMQKKSYKFQNLQNFDLDHQGINDELLDPINETDILVLDGYKFDTAYQQAIKEHIRCKVVCVDDIMAFPFLSDLVINHAGGIEKSEYRILPNAKLLLGPKYAILRKEFYELPQRTPGSGLVEQVFINFGGADPENFTLRVITEIIKNSASFKSIDVVIGAAYLHYQQLQVIVSDFPAIKVHRNLDVHEMKNLMQQSDVAICSASTVAYEYCSVSGLLFVCQTADNQSHLFKFLINEGLALPYDHFWESIREDVSNIRDKMLVSQRLNFDGFAGTRLRKELMLLYLKKNYFIRTASHDDVYTYFEWANDPEVRRNSFTSDSISFDDHNKWFNASLQSKENSFYILSTNQKIPVASIRFKIDGVGAVLSYLIDKRFRGLGLGKTVLEEGTNRFFLENRNVTRVTGLVKEENIASIKAFQSSGFEEKESSVANSRCFFKTKKYE
jgi:UDP-2,4-diacetamido-2,4,6-trideoxy-beta-L-altropyranose hydrolase